MWAALSEKERAPYETVANEAKKRYHAEMEIYRKNCAATKVQTDLDNGKAKKAVTAFALFCRDNRDAIKAENPSFPGLSHNCIGPRLSLLLVRLSLDVPAPSVQTTSPLKEQSRILGEMWRSMDDEARRPFVEVAEKDKERYRHEAGKDKAASEFDGVRKPRNAYAHYAAVCADSERRRPASRVAVPLLSL
jgi:hypothetical protein